MKKIEIISNAKKTDFTTNAKNLKNAISNKLKKDCYIFNDVSDFNGYHFGIIANIYNDNGDKISSYDIGCNDNNKLKFVEIK